MSSGDMPALIGFGCEAVLYGETPQVSSFFSQRSSACLQLQAVTAFFSSSHGWSWLKIDVRQTLVVLLFLPTVCSFSAALHILPSNSIIFIQLLWVSLSNR
jgi:hypothetical protein